MQFDSVAAGTHPSLIYPPYKSTVKRGPSQVPLRIQAIAPTSTNLAARNSLILPNDTDLTVHGSSAPLGEKIVVSGVVRDEDGKPVRNSPVEVWQANSLADTGTSATSTTHHSTLTSTASAKC